MSIYEGAIIPELQRRFIKELEYWMNEYKLADEKLKELQSKYQSTKDTLSNFQQFENELNNQIKLYKQKKDEAINKIKETINKYEILFGKEASFEKNAVKILEDLKIKGDKLLKSYKHLPAIVDFHWKPIKVINDKIYDINVSFEVISPLNSLKEVEVMLIPVEYRYFITKYGMREEDYHKVFPKEEVRSVKIKPKKLEREMFSVDFEDLKGGREYDIKARVEDVAGNEKIVELKTPYIRQFENITPLDKIWIQASYMPWSFKETPMKDETPLLGRYDNADEIAQLKHIDWARGHGIDEFVIDMDGLGDRYFIPRNFLDKGMRVSVFFGPPDFLRGTNSAFPDWAVDLEYPYNYNLFLKKMKTVASWATHTNYSKIGNKPVVMIYDSIAFLNNSRAYKDAKEVFKEITGTYPYLIADEIPKIPYTLTDIQYYMKYKDLSQIDALTGWAGYHNRAKEDYVRNYEKLYDNHLRSWFRFAQDNKFGFIPTVIPGFDNSYSWGPPGLPPIERTTRKFEERLNIAYKYIDNNLNIIRIDTFNDFGEWSYIEPSTKTQFEYLEVLRNFLSKY